jgi:multidrug efflux pump subunit AcrA (membrane-fusion protein)
MYSWMTASVKIIIESKENVLVIPTTYIQSQWGVKFVSNKNSNQVNIEIGSTDGTMTEVVSWLTAGMIITKVIKANSSSSASSSFRVPGMWGGSNMWGGWGFRPGW